MSESGRKVFISYKADNELMRAAAREISGLLEDLGLSQRDGDLQAGDDWATAMEDALIEADVYLLLVPPEQHLSASQLVEIGAAIGGLRHHSNRVIPVLLDGASAADLPSPLRSLNFIDANHMRADEVAESVREALQAVA